MSCVHNAKILITSNNHCVAVPAHIEGDFQGIDTSWGHQKQVPKYQT